MFMRCHELARISGRIYGRKGRSNKWKRNKRKKRKKLGLTTQVFIGLFAGLILGIFLCYVVPDSHIKTDIIVEGILYVIGQGFIRL